MDTNEESKKRGYISEDLPPDFDKALRNESDRGAVMMAVGWLDWVLDGLVKAAFRNEGAHLKEATRLLFKGPSAPLGSFWSKLLLAYALGLIPEEEYEYLQGLRNVRNKMAHRLDHVDFDHPDVKDLLPMPTKEQIREAATPRLDAETAKRVSELGDVEITEIVGMTRRMIFHIKVSTAIGMLEAARKLMKDRQAKTACIAASFEDGRKKGEFPAFNEGDSPPFITRLSSFKKGSTG